MLHVYARGAQWWCHAPGVGRRALGLPVASATHAEAYRVAAQRFAAGALDARASEAARESDLIALGQKYIAESSGRWARRHKANVEYRLAAFFDAVAAQGVTRVEQVTAETLSRYVDTEHARGVTDATINRTIQVVRAMARWAAHRSPPLCDEGALSRWKNLREVARSRDPLIPSPAEWARVVGALERPEASTSVRADPAIERANARGMALLVAVAVQTGLRVDELRHLRAVDIGADVVRVRAHGAWKPKDREERDVPVPPEVAAIARELVAWREVAVGLSGKPVALGGLWLERRLTAAWKACGLPEDDAPGMHDARRTFATEMSRRPGVSVRDVQRLLGHADLETTQRYLGRYRSDADRPAVDMGLAAVLRGEGVATVLPLRRRG